MNETVFRLGELFSGPGGIALGAKWATAQNETEGFSIKHAWASDYDADTCETYRNNLCPTDRKSVVHKDVRELAMSSLMTISDIDALAFGFPCNDFSVVGEQKGTDGVFGPLYSYGINVLKYFQPKWFLADM
ncbi:MAG: DNA cytosine methyltransferase [Pyrinomonadaceae bacterium]